MTTEKTIGDGDINIFVIHSDDSCDFYSKIGSDNFHVMSRRLMLERGIDSYEGLYTALGGAIDFQRIQDIFIGETIPDYEEFLLLARFFQVTPDCFLEFRKLRQNMLNDRREVASMVNSLGIPADEKAGSNLSTEGLNGFALSEEEMTELEKALER
mgnify:CR=1 FL=1